MGADTAPVAAVAFNNLAQQHHFSGSPSNQLSDFVEDDGRRSAALSAAGRGHDAVGARTIATLMYGDTLGNTRDADRLVRIEAVALRKVQKVHQSIADGEILAGLGDQIDERVALVPVRDVADAAGDHDFHVGTRLLHLLQRVQLAMDAVFGLLAHHARVQHHHVGVVRPLRRLEPVRLQSLGQPPRIGDVHLTPDRPDMKGAHKVLGIIRMSFLQ